MLCIPAMDISNNRAVRLYQGDFDKITDYGDPAVVAETLAAAGVSRVHVVDLDAAKGDGTDNYELVIKICRYFHKFDIAVEFGGGIRSSERAKMLYEAGVDYLILGTMAVTDREQVLALAEAYPKGVIIGLDYKRRLPNGSGETAGFETQNLIMEVMIKGWLDGSALGVEEMLKDLRDLPIEAVLLTDVSRDGTMTGPDLLGYQKILAATDQKAVASGGVSSLGDLRDLAGLSVDGKSLYGVVVGKALLSGSIDLGEAVSVCEA